MESDSIVPTIPPDRDPNFASEITKS